jgi:hypothetical protein|tara:strand:+ start:595 stop:849 length:255 start_codon:yes stop_codon:yes gene_type:complete
MIAEAILKIDPNAQVSVDAEDINKITWHDGNPNGITISQIEAQLPIVEKEMADAITKKANDKASADAKLKALGLTDDEIEAFRS